MRNIYGTTFGFILLINILGIYTGNETIEWVSKVLLMPALGLYFIKATFTVRSGLKKWIVTALFFSWLGDILLLFVQADAVYFLAGLSAFLLAHIFYILFFHILRLAEGVKPRPFLLVPVVVYYGVLIGILSPWLGGMKLPVRIYGVVICFMLMLAMHMLFLKNRSAGLLMAAGAISFVISDSALAINKFYTPLPGAGIIIMLTYGIAQFLITHGAIKYLRGK